MWRFAISKKFAISLSPIEFGICEEGRVEVGLQQTHPCRIANGRLQQSGAGGWTETRSREHVVCPVLSFSVGRGERRNRVEGRGLVRVEGAASERGIYSMGESDQDES